MQLPAIIVDVRSPFRFQRKDVSVHKLLQSPLPLERTFTVFEIHGNNLNQITTIGRKERAGTIARSVGGKKNGEPRHLVGLCNATGRDML